MTRLTLGAARPTIAEAIGVCDNDARIPKLLNLAVQRLLPRGKWLGTFQRYRFCTNQACITLPRQFETVEAFALCNCPGIIRNEFFEFQGTSYGILGPDDCIGRLLVPRGMACTFDDPSSKTQKLKVYADCTEATGAYATFLGWDENSNWIRTLIGTDWIDGERILLSTSPQLSVNYFTKLVDVQKPITNCNVRVYAYDVPSGANVKALAIYEPDETAPMYRRYMVPGLDQMGTSQSDCADSVTCDQTQVDLLVKMAFIPVRLDTDYLIIGNLPALELACMAIQAEKNNQFADAEILWEGRPVSHDPSQRRNGAIPLLEQELANFNGDGPVATPRFQDPAMFGAGAIENFT